MADKIIFTGGELDCVRIMSGSPIEGGSAGVQYDSAYARCAIRHPLTTDVTRGMFIDESSAYVNVVTGETLWFHMEFMIDNDAASVINLWELIDVATGFPFLAIRCTSQNVLALVGNTNTGASPTWTPIVSFSQANATKHEFDIKWTLGSPHQVEIYQNRNFLGSGSFTQAAATSIGGFQCRALSSTRAFNISQILATTGIPTVGSKVMSSRASGAGNSNTMVSGVFTDINETVTSDLTSMISDTAGQKFTLAMSDITVPTGYTIKSVFTWSRAKHGGADPDNLKHLIRASGVDYQSPSLAGINVGYMPLGAQWKQHPVGPGNWSNALFNAMEVGAESSNT